MYVIYLSGKWLLVTFLNTLLIKSTFNLFLKHPNHFQENIFDKCNLDIHCIWGNCSFLTKSSETNSVFFGEDGPISTGLARLLVSQEFSPAQHFRQQAMPS